MTQHGFARDHRFSCLQHEPAFCQLVLIDDPETLSRYPFPFRLEITYTATGADLEVALQITNTGDENMPASIGAHPAFNWPLQPGLPKEDYRLTFSDNEIAPVRRLKDGLMRAKPEPTPIQGKTLALSERLFDDDAVILDKLASRSVRYAAGRGPSIEWPGTDLSNSEFGRNQVAHRSSVSTLARLCQPGRVRRRIRRKARSDASRAGRNAKPQLSHPDR
jgi:galactose mutarotase-like enzyme